MCKGVKMIKAVYIIYDKVNRFESLPFSVPSERALAINFAQFCKSMKEKDPFFVAEDYSVEKIGVYDLDTSVEYKDYKQLENDFYMSTGLELSEYIKGETENKK